MATRSPTSQSATLPTHPADDRQFVTALARGLAILRCFDAIRPQLGTTQIAEMTGLPQPTVWRLCHTLQQLGYLVPSPHGDKLRVGMAVLGLGQYSLGSDDIAELAVADILRVAKDTGAAVSLGVVDQGDILIIKRAQGDSPLLLNIAVGSRLPIGTTAAGWAYLACLSKEKRAAVLPTLKHQYRGKLPELRARVEKAVAAYLVQGFVLNEGFFHPEVNAVGAPVLDRNGGCAYVLNCGGPKLDPRRLRDEVGIQLARIAHNMSAALARRAD